MNRKYGLRNQSRNQIRSQRGLALWIKIVLGIFAAGALIAIVATFMVVGLVKDAMDPKKTQSVANKIITLEDPLKGPYVYGRMNFSAMGFSMALLNNTESNALYILMQIPKKDDSSAQKLIDSVAKGEALPSPGAGGAAPAPGSTTKSTMNVEKQGVLDVGGKKMYYVLGKAAKSATTTATSKVEASTGATVETFFGAADPKTPGSVTVLMVQQQDESKHLTLDEVKTFLSNIKAL